jgi:hypothetical protein
MSQESEDSSHPLLAGPGKQAVSGICVSLGPGTVTNTQQVPEMFVE